MPRARSPARDTPETRLLSGEAASLSNADLLAVLLGNINAVHEVQAAYTTLTDLDAALPHELSDLPGLDIAGAARLLAAQELAQRRAIERARRGTSVLKPEDAFKILEPLLRQETREVVMVLALDTKKRLVCSPITVSVGTNDSALCHPREVFRPLIRASASSAIVAHLHPSSGEPVPSPDDVMLTARLKEAGELLCIPIVDHIVIGRGCFISMAERGLV